MGKRITIDIDIDKENTPAFDAEEARQMYENLDPSILELLEEDVWEGSAESRDSDVANER